MFGLIRYVVVLAFVVLPLPRARAEDLYVYPDKGQTAAQLEGDKEACHDWAVKQTGVDPVKMANEPPPTGKSAGAAGLAGGVGIGAARGAIEGDAGAGAVHGLGVAGLVRVIRARRQMQQQHDSYMQAHEQQQSQLADYDRAYGACLSGRGYTVR